MAKLQGTILASKIVPTDSLDTYATHEDKYGRGGHRSVDTIVERDEISPERRKEGMTVYVKENKTKYILESGIENINWKVDSSGGGSGGDGNVAFESLTPEQALSIEILNKQLLDGSQNGDYSNFDLSVLNDNEWSGSPVYSGKIIPITDAELLSRGLVNWAYLTRGVKFNGIYNQAFVYKHYDYVITGKYFQNRYYVWSENGTDWGNHTSCVTATGVKSGNGAGKLQSVSYEQITTNIRLYTVNGKVTQANARSILIGTDFGVNANNNCDLAICGLGTILKDTLTTFPIIPMRKSYLDTTREITISNTSNWNGKKVLWLGTSIPALGGHPEIVAARLGFTLKNEALAGSLMRISRSNGSDMNYAPFNTLTFSRTIAEFQTKYPSNPEYEANSYENKLLGNLGQDLYIFDFGFNDYLADISDFTTLPAITSTSRSTFIGAFNYCIFKLLEQEPKARIAIIAHYEDQLKPNIVKAQEALANYWGFPICSLNKKTGWSQIINPASGKTILNDWLPDGVHPHTDTSGKSSALLARILEEFINGI